ASFTVPTRPPRAHAQGQPPKPSPRLSARKRGYDSAWDKARAGFLAKHPFCDCPVHAGKPNAPRSDTIDHIVAHKGDKVLFWKRSNWRAMAAACHNAKRQREERPGGESRKLADPPPLG